MMYLKKIWAQRGIPYYGGVSSKNDCCFTSKTLDSTLGNIQPNEGLLSSQE
jgi:hypothetical protein